MESHDNEMNFTCAYFILLTPFILAFLGVLLCFLLFDVLFVELPLTCIVCIIALFLHPVPYYEAFRDEWRIHVRACLERLGLQVVFGGSITQLHENGDVTDARYLVCLHPLGSFNLMGYLLFVHMFELLPTLCNPDNKVYMFHEEKILTLPIVRVWARWLGMHWYEKKAWQKAVDSGAHIVIFPGFDHEKLHGNYGEEHYSTSGEVDNGVDRFMSIMTSAADAGMTVVPIYIAGVTHMYDTWHVNAPVVQYSICIPRGKWYTVLPQVVYGFVVVCGRFVNSCEDEPYTQFENDYKESLHAALTESAAILRNKHTYTQEVQLQQQQDEKQEHEHE